MARVATIEKQWREARKAAPRRVAVRSNLPIGPADPKDKNTWTTPDYLFRLLNLIFGFTLDPCCFPFTALCPYFYSEAENGLERNWFGRVFMNPPFGKGKLRLWLQKAYEECKQRKVIVVGLIPYNCDTAQWRDWVGHPNVEILVPPGRIRYGGSKKSPSFNSVIVIFWPDAAFGAKVPGSSKIERSCVHTYRKFHAWVRTWTKQTQISMPVEVLEAAKNQFS